MSTHATGTFELTGWDEKDVETGPTKVSQATISQAWHGDAEGQVTVHTHMTYAADGSAAITGSLRFEGAVDGQAGAFEATGAGDFDGEHVKVDLDITSASGALEGRTGTCSFHAPKGPEGTWVIDLT